MRLYVCLTKVCSLCNAKWMAADLFENRTFSLCVCQSLSLSLSLCRSIYSHTRLHLCAHAMKRTDRMRREARLCCYATKREGEGVASVGQALNCNSSLARLQSRYLPCNSCMLARCRCQVFVPVFIVDTFLYLVARKTHARTHSHT